MKMWLPHMNFMNNTVGRTGFDLCSFGFFFCQISPHENITSSL